jgi:hypothetical protein
MDERHSAEGTDLGQLVAEYGASLLHQFSLIAVGVVLLVVGLLLLWIAYLNFAPHFILFGSLMLIVCPIVFWRAFSTGGVRVLLFEQGFVHREGRLSRPFRWEEIEGVDLTETEHRNTSNNTSYFTHSFRIRATDGRGVVLDDVQISDGEELGRTIMREVQHCQVKARLRWALKLEAAGERDEALAAFEQLLRESPYNEIGNQAKEHILRLREPPPQSEASDTSIQGE